MVIESGAKKTKLTCQNGNWIPNKAFECKGPCRSPDKWISSKKYYLKSKNFMKNDENGEIATRLIIRALQKTDAGSWTMTILFKKPFSIENSIFSALEASVEQSKFNEVISLTSLPFLRSVIIDFDFGLMHFLVIIV